MSATLVHSYVVDEQAAGGALAESFIERLKSGEPVGADDLAQQLSIARFGSVERQRAFAARIQQALIAGVRDA